MRGTALSFSFLPGKAGEALFRDCAVPWAATGQGGSGGDTAWGGNGIAWGGVGKGGAIVEILYFPSSVAPKSERVFRKARFRVSVRKGGLKKGKSRLLFVREGSDGKTRLPFFASFSSPRPVGRREIRLAGGG